MGDIGRLGRQVSNPLGDEVQKDHLHDLKRALDHEHQVDEAIKARHGAKRRWRWPWSRSSKT